MPKQLNVNLAFTADTDAAKRQIMDLQKALQDVAKMPSKSSELFDDSKIKAASKAAMELQKHLQAAVNVNTGQLDLSRFSTSLAASNKDLKTYVNTLMQAGSVGQNAFMQLARAVSTAEAPITRINSHLAQMGTTLKNTVRWQLSSSLLHGFMGSIQAAYGYSQDLNKSLNNIRIVTGQSVDEMATFANQANAAAKALSTTTTSYTDAALIYYQQGIRDQEEIAARTETTIKLANVSRQSAQDVSQEMTAIWNNFADGSKNLEYYADVITALGAATASSSEEIASGLEKFAAIAETVGLSYEYATAAMATITAQTRQSADTVGTGLRTLFSRLEGLKLGETLEDGVDLNKYSEALDKVGVQVLDINGEIRDMDSILDDLGSRWDDLTQAQKVALAQTVGGVRQYTNLIALMDNWDKMQENVLIAEDAEGTLQEQADIYAESWEAAQKRVKAAAEAIYADLFNDKFFIELTNGLAKLIDTVSGVVKGFGGLQGVLLAISSIFLQKYAYEMPTILNNFKQNLMVFTGQAKTQMQDMQDQMMNTLQGIKNDPSTSAVGKIQAEGYAEVIKMRQQLLQQSSTMSKAQQDEYRRQIELVQSGYDEVQAIQEKINAKEKEIAVTEQAIQTKAKEQAANLVSEQSDLYQARLGWENKRSQIADDTSLGADDKAARLRDIDSEIDKIDVKLGVLEPKLQSLGSSMGQGAQAFKDAMLDVTNASTAEEKMSALKNAADMAGEAIGKVAQQYSDQTKRAVAIENMATSIRSQADAWKIDAAAMQNNSKEIDSMKQRMDAYIESLRQQGQEQGINPVFLQHLDELKAKLQSVNSAEGLKGISDQFKNLGNDAEISLNEIVNELDKLEQKLLELGLDPTALQNYRREVEGLAQDMTNMGNTLQNTRGQIGNFQKGLTANSVALTKFASTTMAVYNVINTINSAFQTFGDENASALQKVGAAMGILMAATMAYNQVAGLANMLRTTEIGLLALEKGEIIATTAAQWGLNAAMLANPIGLVIAAIAALIALLAILIGSITALTNYFQRYNTAIKNASKTVEELSSKEQEAKQNADNLRQSIDKYDSCAEKLKACTRGTQEWRDALKETNTAALELLDQVGDNLSADDYQKLLQGYKKNQTFDTDLLDKAQQQADNQAIQASYAKALADYKLQEAKLDKEIANLRKDMDSETAHNLNNAETEQTIKEHMDELAECLDASDLRQKLTKLGIDVSNVSNTTLDKWRKDITEMSDAALAAAVKLRLISEVQVRDWIEANGKEGQYSDEAVGYASAANAQYTDSTYKWDAKINQWANRGFDIKGGKEIAEAYSQATGKNYTLAPLSTTKGSMTFKDEQGNKVDIPYGQISSEIAAWEATSSIGDNLDAATDYLKEASPEGKELGKSIFDSTNSKYGEPDVEGYVGQLTKSELDQYKNKTGQALIKALDLSQDDINQLADLYGVEAQDILDALHNSIKDASKDFDNAGDDLNEHIKNIYKDTVDSLGDITYQEAQDIKSTMEQIFIESEGDVSKVQAYADAMKKIKDSGGDLEEFQKRISEIDWKTASIDDLKDILDDLGIAAEFSEKEIRALFELLKLVPHADKDLTPEEQYKQINDISKGLEFGDTITPEQYAILDEAGLQVENFFIKTRDGSYMLRESGDELRAALDSCGASTGGFTERAVELNNKLQGLLAWQESGIDYNDYTGRQKNGSEGQMLQYGAVSQFTEDSNIDPEMWASIQASMRDDGKLSSSQIDALTQAYGNLGDVLDSKNIAKNIEEIKNQQKELDEQRASGKLQDLPAGVDPEEVEKLADSLMDLRDKADFKGIADDLQPEVADEAAVSMLRYKKAVEQTSKSLSKWKEALDSDDLTERAEAVGELAETFEDLLNVKGLSKEFAADAHNLELLEKAAMGTGEEADAAYEELSALAALDIAEKQLKLDTSQPEFAIENLMTITDAMDDVEIGATLDDAAALAALDGLAAAASSTAAGAEAALESMFPDFDFTVEDHPVDNEKSNTYFDAVAKVTPQQVQTASMVGGQMTQGTVTQDSVTWDVHPSEVKGVDRSVVSVPKVTSAKRKSAGGTFKRTNAGGGGGGRGGGGGGRRGGGGRQAERNRVAMKKPTDNKERYHVVKNQLQSIEGQLKKIDTAYDRAFGGSKIKLLDQQIAKQKELINKQKEYVKEIQNYQKKDKNNLINGTTQYWSEVDGKMKTTEAGARNYLGMGINFDGNGNITNYDALIEAANKKYNQAIAIVNKHTTDDEGAKRLKEEADAGYQGFMDLLKQYEETEDLLVEQQQKLQEEQNKLYDQLLEKTQLVVTLKINVEDDNLKLIDYFLNKIEDDAYKAAKRIALMGDELQSSINKVDAYREGLTSIFNNHDVNGANIISQLESGKNVDATALLKNMEKNGNTLTEAEVSAIREYIEGLLDEMQKADEYRREIVEEIGKVMEENIHRLDRITDKMSHLQNVSNSYKNLVDLTGRKYLKITTDMYAAMERTNVQLATQATDMARQRKEQAEEQYRNMLAQYQSVQNILSEEEKQKWQEQLETAEDYVQEMTENYYSSWEEAIEAVNTKFESVMKTMAEDFSATMAGAMGNLEGLRNRFDLKKEISDVYVPEYEKMYQLTKLIRDAQNKIDETDNLRVKQELQAVQEKILAARESEAKISQYEIDYLQKELELKAAQLALEEANQVKSQVRMSRDSEGNYSYVYTADEQAVEQAEEDYAAKLYEMQMLNEEYIYNLQQQLIELEDSYIEAMQEAADIYGQGTEEYYEAIKNIQEDYQQYFKELTSELNLALENQQEVSTIHAEIYEQLTGDVYQANVELTTSWNETVLAALTDIEILTEYEQNWASATEEVYNIAKTAAREWQSEMEAVYEAAGSAIYNFSSESTAELQRVADQGTITKDQMQNAMSEIKTAINEVMNAITQWEQQYSEVVQKMLTINEKLVKSFNDLLKAWSGVSEAAKKYEKSNASSTGGKGKTFSYTTGGTGGYVGGGGGGGGSCFVAGTLVSTNNGFINIENIKIGDIVLSYNEKTKQNEYSKVAQTMIHATVEQIYSIYIEDDVIKATGIHKFYIKNNNKNSWIQVQNLQKDNEVLFANGTWHKIKKIEKNMQALKVYNFEVMNNHNYYVGKNSILVHNKGGGGSPGAITPPRGSRMPTGPRGNTTPVWQRISFMRGATGLYTGDWAGDEGKIAMLDKKELLLNQTDTTNILEAVNMVREMSRIIDLNSLVSSTGLSWLTPPSTEKSLETQNLEQEVHITAEFPNATNKNEILAAFDNVINLASQYANREK